MEINSPQEFGEYLKKEKFQYEMFPDDLDARLKAVRYHYEKEIKEHNYSVDKEFDGIKRSMFDEVIAQLVKEFYTIVPEEISTKFQEHFYFSTAQTRKIGGSIYKHRDKPYFAILINSSLITLLHKVGKLDVALQNPSCVKFCNRFPDQSVSFEELVKMRAEYFAYFTTQKMAHGPQLLLRDPENLMHLSRLQIQEKFILFHEIAHFLNGDSSQRKANQRLVPKLGNIDHQREFLADWIAFALLLRSAKASEDITKELRLHILFAIIHLFDIMYLVQPQDGEKHPLPLNRMNAIVELYYGEKIADIVAKTYKDKSEMTKLHPSNIPVIVSREEEMDKWVDQLLEKAFDEDNLTGLAKHQ